MPDRFVFRHYRTKKSTPVVLAMVSIGVMFVIQAIVRRPLTESVVRYASSVGIVLIICLTLLVFYNDIVRYFFKSYSYFFYPEAWVLPF